MDATILMSKSRHSPGKSRAAVGRKAGLYDSTTHGWFSRAGTLTFLVCIIVGCLGAAKLASKQPEPATASSPFFTLLVPSGTICKRLRGTEDKLLCKTPAGQRFVWPDNCEPRGHGCTPYVMESHRK